MIIARALLVLVVFGVCHSKKVKHSASQNLALHKPAYASSMWDAAESFPSKVVDGNFDTNYRHGSCFCSGTSDSNPWLSVDLGAEYYVNKVVVTNRGDAGADRMDKFIVGLANVSPTPNSPLSITYTTCGQYPGAAPLGQNMTVSCIPGLSAARYVIIRNGKFYLNFCELQVFGTKTLDRCDCDCSKDATCTVTRDSYTCECKSGFTGDGIRCSDVNECLVDNGGCSSHALCVNTPGSFTCACERGFTGNGFKCSDDNECSVNNGGCSKHATCTNTPGSFTCACKPGYSGNGFTCSVPRDCSDLFALGYTASGVYTVYIGDTYRPLAVYCDMTKSSGGWTVFQRRQDGNVNFYRNWADYRQGFGNQYGEFWLGNDNLNLLTTSKRYKLRIELTAFNGSSGYAEYDNFRVESAADKYRLSSIGSYSGTVGDSLSYQLRQQFTTYDQDNDAWPNNCGVTFKGAWWYNACHNSNLNGFYYGGPHESYADGIEWHTWTGHYYSLKTTEMKIKPVH